MLVTDTRLPDKLIGTERKDAHRKPPLLNLRVAEIMGWVSVNIGLL
jgi:hypothetical protein